MRTIVVGLFASLIGAAPLQAGPYPDRPIAIVVPFGKGTTADLIAAVVADAVSKNIGQKVVVAVDGSDDGTEVMLGATIGAGVAIVPFSGPTSATPFGEAGNDCGED